MQKPAKPEEEGEARTAKTIDSVDLQKAPDDSSGKLLTEPNAGSTEDPGKELAKTPAEDFHASQSQM